MNTFIPVTTGDDLIDLTTIEISLEYNMKTNAILTNYFHLVHKISLLTSKLICIFSSYSFLVFTFTFWYQKTDLILRLQNTHYLFWEILDDYNETIIENIDNLMLFHKHTNSIYFRCANGKNWRNKDLLQSFDKVLEMNDRNVFIFIGVPFLLYDDINLEIDEEIVITEMKKNIKLISTSNSKSNLIILADKRYVTYEFNDLFMNNYFGKSISVEQCHHIIINNRILYNDNMSV